MSNEIKEKEECEKYARDHRKELDAQEVKIGDVVKVLVGQFAGETGIIVGISACYNDYTDPYYEVDMNCEVPEKYKCRKTLMTPNNVIGGLSAHEFEVIGNRAPKQPSMEIKQGDRVRVPKDAPKMYMCEDSILPLLECEVLEVETDNARIEPKDPDGYLFKPLTIPTKYLVKVDAEAKEAKFKVGDRIKFKSLEELKKIKHKSFHWALPICAGKFATIIGIDDVGGYIVDIDKDGRGYIDDMIEFKVGPIATKFKVGDIIDTPKGNGTVHIAFDDYCAVKLDNGEWYVYMKTNIPYAPYTEPTEQTEAEKKPSDGISEESAKEISDMLEAYTKALSGIADSFDWQRYETNIAKDVVLKVANKYDPKEAAEYAVLVAKAVVEGLKRK